MPGSGVLSYGVAAAAFAVLAILAFTADRSIRQGRALILAASVSAVWAGIIATMESGRTVPYLVVMAVEAARFACWWRFLYLLAPSKWPGTLRWLIPVLFVGWVVFGGMIAGPGRVLTIGGLVAALLGLVVLEQTVRNVPPQVRHDMRYLTIGIGGLFAFDLFLFSQAELFRRIDASSWHLRGIVNALLVPLLIVGARRLSQVRFELFVSRQMTFYTTAFVAVGAYILVIAGAGLLIRNLGGQWGESARLVFLGGAIVVLATLVGSVTIRRQIRVFLSKHFYRSKYDYRLEWLRFIGTLSGARDVPGAAVQSVAQILGSPGGVLYRQPEGASAFIPVGSWPGTIDGLTDTHSFPADSPLAAFMCARRWIVDLREREQQPDLYDHAELPDWLVIDKRWRLVSPIFLGDTLLGFFLLLEPPTRFRLTYEDRDLLNTAGQHVATLLAQQDADRRIAELSQFEAYNRLTTFVMHDLKNCAAQLSLLVGNAARHRSNPEFVDDAFATIERTAERMTRLIEQLRRKSVDAAVRPVDLHEALLAALSRCAAINPQPALEPVPERSWMVRADPERLTAALEHVIRNAQQAAGEAGEVHISVEEREGTARVSVRDTGAGMDAEFIHTRLFRPFDSTKGSGMGIGAYQAREFARSVGGEVDVHSAPGRGTSFFLDLPLVLS